MGQVCDTLNHIFITDKCVQVEHYALLGNLDILKQRVRPSTFVGHLRRP